MWYKEKSVSELEKILKNDDLSDSESLYVEYEKSARVLENILENKIIDPKELTEALEYFEDMKDINCDIEEYWDTTDATNPTPLIKRAKSVLNLLNMQL